MKFYCVFALNFWAPICVCHAKFGVFSFGGGADITNMFKDIIKNNCFSEWSESHFCVGIFEIWWIFWNRENIVSGHNQVNRQACNCTKCHQYYFIPISSTWYTPVSSWSNRPLLSVGDSSCSWVFCLCTGLQGETYTQLKGWQSMSPVAIVLIWNRVHSGGYSHWKTQTCSFSCKVYWDTSSGMWVVSQQCNGMQYTNPNIGM